MLIKKRTGIEIPSSEITSHHTYLSRRHFIKGAALSGMGALLAACAPANSTSSPTAAATAAGETAVSTLPSATAEISATADELGNKLNTLEAITTHNNYYEFDTSKSAPAQLATNFPTDPWAIEVSGHVKNAKTFTIEDLLNFDQEERIYRMRCVEGWSMVIPWNGFPLSKLLDEVEPTSDAQYVRFETILDPDNMPGQKSPYFKWPYVEGLRLDEAMNDLTLLSTGLYGQSLLPQNGAPIRLVVPWKYGFKGIKSIVKIELVDTMPTSLWMAAASNEYGFYANVNPNVDHPRWSQATERRIGELGRTKTLMFNGYEEQVAHMYSSPFTDTTGQQGQ